MNFADAGYPAVPYPGARPDVAFVHLDGTGHLLVGDGARWLVDGVDLDSWLAGYGAPPLAGRHALLAYGSNACPSKISWLRDVHGLDGPVVVLQVNTHGLAAVWASGFRVVDDQRPATLAAVDGVSERHGLWLATDEQVAVLDVCEGRGARYELARLPVGSVTLVDGRPVETPLAYVSGSPGRQPLLVDGAPVRCVDVPQHVARKLEGVPAASDGLDREVLAPAHPYARQS